MLSRFVIAFLPGSKGLLISWLLFLPAVILEPKKVKSFTFSIVSPSICHEVMGLDAMILVFLMLSFKPAFSLSSFTLLFRFHQEALQFLFSTRHLLMCPQPRKWGPGRLGGRVWTNGLWGLGWTDGLCLTDCVMASGKGTHRRRGLEVGLWWEVSKKLGSVLYLPRAESVRWSLT